MIFVRFATRFFITRCACGSIFFEKRRPRRIVPRMLAKGAGDTKDVTRARERDASLNRRGRNSPEATWIRRIIKNDVGRIKFHTDLSRVGISRSPLPSPALPPLPPRPTPPRPFPVFFPAPLFDLLFRPSGALWEPTSPKKSPLGLPTASKSAPKWSPGGARRPTFWILAPP